MYRRALLGPSSALRLPATTSRHALCYRPPYPNPRPRYLSTPGQSQGPQKPSQTPAPREGDVEAESEQPPQAESSSSSPSPSSQSQDASPLEARANSSSHPPSDGGDPSAGPSTDAEEMQARMKEWTHGALRDVRQRGDAFTAQVAKTFAQLGRELNRVTGYEEIEALKRKVVEQELRIDDAREEARQAKDAYDTAVRQRAKSQREVNDLLQRKSHWTDEDVSRFTTLVREDHAREHDEARAKAAAAAAEDAVEREFSELTRVILSRYHEEQAWSDKIRSASTYGQLAVLALNAAVFVLAIVLVEPWKRRRLAQTFERKVEEMTREIEERFDARTARLDERAEEQARLLGVVLETVRATTRLESVDVEREAAKEAEGQAGQGARIPAVPRSEQELLLLMSASAAAAGLVGWLARSWYG